MKVRGKEPVPIFTALQRFKSLDVQADVMYDFIHGCLVSLHCY
jgi:hypothetical protein